MLLDILSTCRKGGCLWSSLEIWNKQILYPKSPANRFSHWSKLCHVHCQPGNGTKLSYLGWNYVNLLILEPFTSIGSQGREVILRTGGVYLSKREQTLRRIPQDLAQRPGCSHWRHGNPYPEATIAFCHCTAPAVIKLVIAYLQGIYLLVSM